MSGINAYNSALQHHRSYPNKIYEYELSKSMLAQARRAALMEQSAKAKTHETQEQQHNLSFSKQEAEALKQAYITDNNIFTDSNLTRQEKEVKRFTTRTSLNFLPNGKCQLVTREGIKAVSSKNIKEDSKHFINEAKNPEGFEIRGKKRGYDTKIFLTYNSIDKQCLEHIINNKPGKKKDMSFTDLSSEKNPVLKVKQRACQLLDTLDDIYSITSYEE